MYKNRKIIAYLSIVMILIVTTIALICENLNNDNTLNEINELEATIISFENDEVTIRDTNNIIYTFKNENIKGEIGDKILIEYSGLLDKNKNLQNVNISDYSILNTVNEENSDLPNDLQDNGIFNTYYNLAYNKLKDLSLEEKIGQLILARFPDKNAIEDLKEYKLGGFVFFEKDFKDKTKEEVINIISSLQEESKIPLLTAVDEEGGTVVRISSNPLLASSKFLSPRELYTKGGLDTIREDTINKSKLLNSLGINLNLAPVVDVSTDPNDYMYKRSIGENTEITSEFAKTVIEASIGTKLSYTLKHFPGYGNNEDTHVTSATDNRSYDEILNNDLPPFKSGIDAGAEAVLVSHNIVNSIDPDNPASLSASVHNLLRNNLDFTGVVITDDLSMAATSSIPNNAVRALIAGNDLIITTDYKTSIESIKNAIENGDLSEGIIDRLAFRVIAWKYYKGLMFEGK